jgi:CHAD domain-containing protein
MGLDRRLRALVHRHHEELLSHVPGIRDGDPDAIHDARVATRRLRAVLTVLHGGQDADDSPAEKQVKPLTRALGDARDLDVAVELLEQKVWELPDAARAALLLREATVRERDTVRRQLIKTIEHSDLDALASGDRSAAHSWWSPRIGRGLRQRIHAQSCNVADSVERLSGVYFPNRTHKMRIQVKRLRYLIETARHAGWWREREELGVLKRVQAVLGDLHDREELMRRLSQTGDQLGGIDLLRGRLVAERDGLYRDYLGKRDDLRRVSRLIRDRTKPDRHWGPAAMMAVPSAIALGFIAAAGAGASSKRRASREPRLVTPRSLSPR